MFNFKFDFFSLKRKIRRKCHIKLIVTSLPKNTHTVNLFNASSFIDRYEREKKRFPLKITIPVFT